MIGSFHAAMHSWLAANADALRDHVIFSTVVLLALLTISLVPRLHARTRYALVFLGIVKILVPAAVFSRLATMLTTHAVELPSLSMSATFTSLSITPARSEVLCIFAAIWAAGAMAIVLRALAIDRQWRRTVRVAMPASPREIAAMRRVSLQANRRRAPRVARAVSGVPLTAGFIHPVVLLPECCAETLDDDELEAVLAHELTHVARRHNLAAMIQNVAVALFWFNPVLWVAKKRLQAEAEKDCDEQVLTFVPDPAAYVAGVLKVSYGFIAPQPAGVSCMSTSQLKERMDHLMKSHTHSVPHRLAIGFGIAAVAITTVFVSAATPGPSSSPAVAHKAGITDPKLVTKVEPVYPPTARANRVQGIVIVSATIEATGNVSAVSVSKGLDGEDGKALNEAAVAAVKQWKFEPARKNGKAVKTDYTITIRFLLD